MTFLTQIIEIKDLPKDALLASFHAVGLYGYIHHKEGIEIMKKLSKRKGV